VSFGSLQFPALSSGGEDHQSCSHSEPNLCLDPDPLRYYLTATAPETRDTPAAVFVGGFRRKAPWFRIKADPQAAATSVTVTWSERVVNNLKMILAPTRCVPHTPTPVSRPRNGRSSLMARGNCATMGAQ
jgi:hypothetical protein